MTIPLRMPTNPNSQLRRKLHTVANKPQWYGKAVEWAVENGVTNGTSASTFSPNAGCTRAQIVTFLFRAYNK